MAEFIASRVNHPPVLNLMFQLRGTGTAAVMLPPAPAPKSEWLLAVRSSDRWPMVGGEADLEKNTISW
jgi:uncharacterized membrane protein